MSEQDLKQTAQIRKAIMPLIQLLKSEANVEITKHLSVIDAKLDEIAKRENIIKVSPPEVSVTVSIPDELTKSIQKMSEPAPEVVDTPTDYQPHDQSKSQVYQYSGFVRSDGKYYIQRVAKGEQRYAKGAGDYTEAWSKRSKLNYGRIDESS